MSIQIKNTHKPFSHLPGACCPILQTPFILQAYPTKLRIFDADRLIASFDIALTGPVDKFTLLLDFARQKAVVYGFAQEGYFRLEIYREEQNLVLDPVKFPKTLATKKILWTGFDQAIIKSLPSISLGCHKNQNVERIRARSQIEEFIPFWLQLGYLLPIKDQNVPTTGNFFLLEKLQHILESGDTLRIEPLLQTLLQCGFTSIFTPKVSDDLFLGIIPEAYSKAPEAHPLLLLKVLSKMLIGLFFEEKESTITFLPNLPPALHSGRIKGLMSEKGDLFDLEWSKKTLKKLIIWPRSSHRLAIIVPGRTQCRLQKEHEHRLDQMLSLQVGEKLFIDRFTS